MLRERYARSRLSDHQVAAITWLASQPGGPANILVLSEDWSSDCRRDVPMLARLAEAGGLELRIFNRDGAKILGARRPDPAAAPDGNHDLMLEFMNRRTAGSGRRRRWPSCTRRTSRSSVGTSSIRPSTTRIAFRGHRQAPRPGETEAQTRERSAREFAALQASPFFDLWAAAGIDEILSALYEKLVIRAR